MTDSNPFASPTPSSPSDSAFTEQIKPPQSVTLILQAEDYLAFVSHLNNTDPTVRRVLRQQTIRLLVCAVVLFVLTFGLKERPPALEPVANMFRMMAVLIGATAALRSPLAKWKARRQVARSIRLGMYGRVDEAITVTIDERGVRLQDSGGDGLRYWSGLERVAATNQHLFLYLQPTLAAILPLRAFQSKAQFRGWCDLAERLWRSATRAGQTAPGSPA